MKKLKLIIAIICFSIVGVMSAYAFDLTEGQVNPAPFCNCVIDGNWGKVTINEGGAQPDVRCLNVPCIIVPILPFP